VASGFSRKDAAVASLGIVLTLASSLSGSVQKPAPKAEARVPFSVGESLTYDVSWSTFFTAGSATLSVREKKPSYGSTAYYIVAEGQPTGLVARLYALYYKADSLLDVFTLLPQRGSIYSRERGRERMKATVFNRPAKKAQYEVRTATVVKTELAIPADTQDALGVIYALRARPLKPRDRFTIPVCDTGELYQVQFTVGAIETVRSAIGDMRAWKIMPVLPPAPGQEARRLTLWISDDERKLPVKLQAQLAVGSFELTLRSAAR